MRAGRAAVPFGGHCCSYAPGTLRLCVDPAAADRRVLEHYRLDGAAYGEGATGAFVAPFGVAAMVGGGGGQAWLDALWEWMAASPPEPGRYYSASVQLQVMLVVSHNWWPPSAPGVESGGVGRGFP